MLSWLLLVASFLSCVRSSVKIAEGEGNEDVKSIAVALGSQSSDVSDFSRAAQFKVR